MRDHETGLSDRAWFVASPTGACEVDRLHTFLPGGGAAARSNERTEDEDDRMRRSPSVLYPFTYELREFSCESCRAAFVARSLRSTTSTKSTPLSRLNGQGRGMARNITAEPSNPRLPRNACISLIRSIPSSAQKLCIMMLT